MEGLKLLMEKHGHMVVRKKGRKEIKKWKPMSAETLSQKLGCTSVTVHNWLGGRTSPRKSDIEKLCRVFKCEHKDLL